MAAWTSLYDASKNEPTGPGEHRVRPGGRRAMRQPQRRQRIPGGTRCWIRLLADDPGLAPDDLSRASVPEGAAAPPAPMAPMLPPMPNFAPGLPSLGGGPRAGYRFPACRVTTGRIRRCKASVTKTCWTPRTTRIRRSTPPRMNRTITAATPVRMRRRWTNRRRPVPTTVTLPDGETVTAASPQLAAAIKAAVGGAPIADAFHQQGITIPPPGTAVTNPIDAAHVVPGGYRHLHRPSRPCPGPR